LKEALKLTKSGYLLAAKDIISMNSKP